jgi:hypothetical protein
MGADWKEVEKLRDPVGWHGWRYMSVCCRGSWTNTSRCKQSSERCEFVWTVMRRSEVEVDDAGCLPAAHPLASNQADRHHFAMALYSVLQTVTLMFMRCHIVVLSLMSLCKRDN